jgi:dienelactone hydrolase
LYRKKSGTFYLIISWGYILFYQKTKIITLVLGLECEAVSPDGRYLLYGELIGLSERHLGLLDLTTGKARYIMRVPGGNNIDGDFAADEVVFRSAWGSDRFRIWRYRFGSRAPAPVEPPFDNDVDSLSLYTAGRVAVVTYRAALTGHTAIFIDGFDTPQTFGFSPEDIVDAVFSRTDPGHGIVSVGNAATPLRYYRVGTEEPELIYDSNESGIDNTFFAEARSLRVPSFDGLEIPVHLFIPNGTSASKPRPVIVVIHGGPESHVDPVYMAKLQYLTNRGFIVVVPNVRGSTGFGKHYSFLDNGDWGGAHIRDTVEVAKFVRTLGFVDGDNLFVAGSSFGGFSVMSLITQYPDTFRAAVNFFGFTELATFVDSWPPYLERRLFADLGFDPRTDRARNRARSPYYHLERIDIPLQVHQGANDRRVPRAQSDKLVKRMQERGLTVEYFVYPDEGHGFTRLENERASFERMVAFFKRHMLSNKAEAGSKNVSPWEHPRRKPRAVVQQTSDRIVGLAGLGPIYCSDGRAAQIFPIFRCVGRPALGARSGGAEMGAGGRVQRLRNGRIPVQADPGPGEKMVGAPIDLAGLHTRRMRHGMRAHVRSELYGYLDETHLAPATPDQHPLTLEGIRDAKRGGEDGR